MLGIGQSIEAHIFSLMIFFLLSHWMACIYIMAAYISVQNKNESVNWIIAKECDDYGDIQLYVTSFYFIIMTVTTVGYGDLSGFNTPERIICAIL